MVWKRRADRCCLDRRRPYRRAGIRRVPGGAHRQRVLAAVHDRGAVLRTAAQRAAVQDVLPACDGAAGKQQQAGEDRSRPVQPGDPGCAIRGRRGRKPDGWPTTWARCTTRSPHRCRRHSSSSTRACAWPTRSTMARRCAHSARHARSIRTARCATGVKRWCSDPISTRRWMTPPLPRAVDAIGRARGVSTKASLKERALIEALAARYSADADRPTVRRWTKPTRRQCRSSRRSIPATTRSRVQYAESLMDLQPWDYWEGGTKPKGRTEEIIGLLEQVLTRSPDHPGAIHYYIHMVEASSDPKRALPYAQRLGRADARCGALGAHAVPHLLPRGHVQGGGGGQQAGGGGG